MSIQKKTERLDGGMWPVMLTPFKENQKIDKAGLRKLTEFYINSGAAGLFANCLSSEMYQLSDDERIKIVKEVIETADNKIPVIATGTFWQNKKNNIEFIKKVYDLGVKAVIINSNQLSREADSEEVFKSNLDVIITKTEDIPLGIYECPDPYKRLISPALLKWISRTNRFLYFKDTSCDISLIKKKLEVIRGTSLGLYNANIPTALESLKLGAKGISPIGANFFPEIYQYFYKKHNNKRSERSIKSLNAWLSVIDPLIHAFYPFSAKYFLQMRGIKISSMTRIKTLPFQSQDITRLHDLMKVFEEMAEKYKIKKVI